MENILYISDLKYEELEKNFKRICSFLRSSDSHKLLQILNELKKNKCCTLEAYQEMILIINNIENDIIRQKNIKAKKKNKTKEEALENKQIIELVNTLKLQFLSKYFFSAYDQSINKLNKNELVRSIKKI